MGDMKLDRWKRSCSWALNATLWCCTLILYSAGTTKGFWSVLYKDQADCYVKDKLEREETRGREIGQEAVSFWFR